MTRCAAAIWLACLAPTLIFSQDLRDRVGDWEDAVPGYRFVFPRDHGSHPPYKIEWWHYIGNVDTADGRRYGYQVTFFRVGIDPAPTNPSRWAVRDLFMTHLSVTDIGAGRHVTAERLNRAAIGWAGAETETLRVWNEDWRAERDGHTQLLEASDREKRFGVKLRLEPRKPPVLHGEAGFSRKGAHVRSASYHSSLTRLETRGMLTIDGEAVAVEGVSWMDHEFGTHFLDAAQLGWDWFAIQLDDGTDVMLYSIRRKDGQRDPHSRGTMVDAAGRGASLAAAELQLDPGREWQSPSTGARYPVGWRIEIPRLALTLDVRAAVDAQELNTEQSTGVTYWEGAILVRGTKGGRPVAGRGYLEMTGYTGRPISEVLGGRDMQHSGDRRQE